MFCIATLAINITVATITDDPKNVGILDVHTNNNQNKNHQYHNQYVHVVLGQAKNQYKCNNRKETY